MDEVTKRLAYAIRDTRHLEDDEDRANFVYNHLVNNGLVLVRKSDLDAEYQQGRSDALWEAAQNEDY